MIARIRKFICQTCYRLSFALSRLGRRFQDDTLDAYRKKREHLQAAKYWHRNIEQRERKYLQEMQDKYPMHIKAPK